MQFVEVAEYGGMAKRSKKPSGKDQALRPEMRDLIARFDAKDRRDKDGNKRDGRSKERRRRGDNPVHAA